MFIRAKPDVIHYVDSPEISLQEQRSGQSNSQIVLTWPIPEGLDKLVVKRQPAPASPSKTVDNHRAELPRVKLVRYSHQDYREKLSDSNTVITR